MPDSNSSLFQIQIKRGSRDYEDEFERVWAAERASMGLSEGTPIENLARNCAQFGWIRMHLHLLDEELRHRC